MILKITHNHGFNGAGGGVFMKNFTEIDFLVVSYTRGDRYLSDAFGPMKNIDPSRSYYWSKVRAYV